MHGRLDDMKHACGERFQVHLTARRSGELCQGFLGVILAPVKAPVDEILETATKRAKEGGYQQGGQHDSSGFHLHHLDNRVAADLNPPSETLASG